MPSCHFGGREKEEKKGRGDRGKKEGGRKRTEGGGGKGGRKRGTKLSAFFKDRRKNDHGRPKAKEISLKIRNNANAN